MIMTSTIAVYLCQQLILFGNTYSDVPSQQEPKVGLLSLLLSLFLKLIIEVLCIWSVVYCSLNCL